jgi:MFS family permease
VAAGQNLAGALWPPAFSVIGEAGGWRTSFMVFGLFAFVTVLPLTLFLRQRAPVSSTSTHTHGSVAGRVLGLPANLVHAILFLMQVLCCLAMAAPFVHGPAHVSDLGHSMALGATMLTVILTVSLISLLTLGHIADRIGGLRTLVIASAMQAVALLLYANFESLPMLYASAVVFGLGFGGLVPSYAIVIRELFPASQVGWRIASTFMGGTLGMALGGWLAGRIFDAMGHYHMAFYLGFVFNLANIALGCFLLWRWLGAHGGDLREALRRV